MKTILIAVQACLLASNFANAADKCATPFSSFMKCLMVEVDNKLQAYQQESSPVIQEAIKKCFIKEKCEAPDFTKSNIDYFLSEPWSGRVRKMLDVLENTDPKVQQCMIEYFKELAVKKVRECVQQYGTDDIKDFEMPPLPAIKSLDISKLKKMVLNRMVVWNTTLKCGRSNSDDASLQRTIDCTNSERSKRGEGLCSAREKCRKESFASNAACSSRFDSVRKALCTCAKEEAKKYSSKESGSFIESWKQMKDTVLQGPMEEKFKKCHTSNNVPYPEDKVAEVKQALKDSLLDVIKQRSIPPQLLEALSTVASSMRDITEEWRNAFCHECGEKSGDAENAGAKRVRNYLARQEEQRNGAGNGGGSSGPNIGDALREALSG